MRYLREIRLDAAGLKLYEDKKTVGAADFFAVNEYADVTGTSKGRGTAGVMKKYHFQGFERTHGSHEFFRHGGSIGTRLTPGMTLAGKKMPGRMGNVPVVIQNLKVIRVDAERNLIFLAGGVPGPNGGFVVIRKAVRTPRPSQMPNRKKAQVVNVNKR